MEENEEPKSKRKRPNPIHRWRESETMMLLTAVVEAVKDNQESFEKPIAQKFYAKIQESVPELSQISWICMKGKMRHCKKSYIEANKWKGQTGAGLLESGEEKTVADYIAKICPYYDLLEQIFCNRKSVNPTIFDTTMNMAELFEDATEVVEIEYLADESTLSQSSDFASDTPTTSSRFLSELQGFKNVPRQKKSSASGISLLLSMQENKLAFEKQKFEWQVEKDNKELEIKAQEKETDALRIQKEYELKKLEIEKDERIQMEKLKLEKELEEKIRMYEIEMKYNVKK